MDRARGSAKSLTCRWCARASGSNSRPMPRTSNAGCACWNSSTSGIVLSRPRKFEQGHAVSETLVVVGNGMAAARLVDELTKVALGRYAVAVIGDEPRLAYNRVLLSSVLAGETASHDIELRPAAWWRDRGVTLKYGCLATEIDVGRHEVKIENEESVPYSKLILTTGSSALRLNVPGADLPGVNTFRHGRRAGHPGPSDGPADGASARCARRRVAEITGRAQGH